MGSCVANHRAENVLRVVPRFVAPICSKNPPELGGGGSCWFVLKLVLWLVLRPLVGVCGANKCGLAIVCVTEYLRVYSSVWVPQFDDWDALLVHLYVFLDYVSVHAAP